MSAGKFLKSLTARPSPSPQCAQSVAGAVRSAGEGRLVFFLWDTLPTGEGKLVTEMQYTKEGCVGSRPASLLLWEGGDSLSGDTEKRPGDGAAASPVLHDSFFFVVVGCLF